MGAFLPDGRTFADFSMVRGQDLMIDLIDVATGRVRATIPTPHDGIIGLAVSEDGRTMAPWWPMAMNTRSSIATWSRAGIRAVLSRSQCAGAMRPFRTMDDGWRFLRRPGRQRRGPVGTWTGIARP